jgi:hypothetical protein
LRKARTRKREVFVLVRLNWLPLLRNKAHPVVALPSVDDQWSTATNASALVLKGVNIDCLGKVGE